MPKNKANLSTTDKMSSTTERKRPEIAAKNKGPGPASYSLPPTLGKTGTMKHDPTKAAGSAFSFGSRPVTCMIENWRQPGPLYKPEKDMTNKGVCKSPTYTMQHAFKPLKDQGVPSPAAYEVEKTQIIKQKKMPAYTMGTRLNPLPEDALQKPSPNAYYLPTTLGPTKIYGGRNSPSHSLKGKLLKGNAMEDLAKSPGIGSYTLPRAERNSNRAPAFTMSSKACMPPEGTWLKTPGPGHYPIARSKKETPAYSLGIRHSEYTMDNLQASTDTRTKNVQTMGSLGRLPVSA